MLNSFSNSKVKAGLLMVGFVFSLFTVTQLASRINTFQTQPSSAQAATEINTGSVVPTFTPREMEILQLVNNLKSRTPLTGNGFGISYNYRQASFRVVLISDYVQSKTNFETWISNQGYESIPSDYFYFELSDTLATPTPIPPTPTPTPLPATNSYLPKGYQDPSSSSCQVNGWTCDTDNNSRPLAVHIYNGSTFVSSTIANTTRETAVANLCGGVATHGFSTNLSSILSPGTYNLTAYAINIDSAGSTNGPNPILKNSITQTNTVSVTCSAPPTPTPVPNLYLPKGSNDVNAVNNSCALAGWACDQDSYSTPLAIHVYNGSSFVAVFTANRTRETAVANLCGGIATHGFYYNFSTKLKTGTYYLTAYAINVNKNGLNSGINPYLRNSSTGASTVKIVCP